MTQLRLSKTFTAFFESGKAGGGLIVLCTLLSLALANSPAGTAYVDFWHLEMAGGSVEHWINDGLMAVFFLLIGLELERELYVGELSDLRSALLPLVAAVGGVALPALIHFGLNAGTPSQPGMGIPMATDITFALGVLALVGSSVPASLKVFLTALAVMDDLAAIVVIAVFYTAELSVGYLAGALGVFGLLVVLNRLRVTSLVPYVLGGLLMWALMLRSGVHATVAGVLLAFAVPFSGRDNDQDSPSHRLEGVLHRPVAFVIVPIFALANTAIIIGDDALSGLAEGNSLGIMLGLLIGKPVGIILLAFAAVAAGVCRLPIELSWKHITGAGLLGGIGFTMSIFITNLAFAGQPDTIDTSKTAILLASAVAGTAGFVWLRSIGPSRAESPRDGRS